MVGWEGAGRGGARVVARAAVARAEARVVARAEARAAVARAAVGSAVVMEEEESVLRKAPCLPPAEHRLVLMLEIDEM